MLTLVKIKSFGRLAACQLLGIFAYNLLKMIGTQPNKKVCRMTRYIIYGSLAILERPSKNVCCHVDNISDAFIR